VQRVIISNVAILKNHFYKTIFLFLIQNYVRELLFPFFPCFIFLLHCPYVKQELSPLVWTVKDSAQVNLKHSAELIQGQNTSF